MQSSSPQPVTARSVSLTSRSAVLNLSDGSLFRKHNYSPVRKVVLNLFIFLLKEHHKGLSCFVSKCASGETKNPSADFSSCKCLKRATTGGAAIEPSSDKAEFDAIINDVEAV
jgi:hypothetical protein